MKIMTLKVLVLDPGHQSIPNADTGCHGFGVTEQDIVLDICKRAKPLIELNGIKVIMTRDGAKVNGDGSSLNASLNTRCQIANNAKADLFLSVHADAYNSQAYGTTVHIYGLGGKAEKFAKILNPQMGNLFYNRGIKVSNFEVIRDTHMAAALLETAFLDNKGDNSKLVDPSVRQEIAVIIAKSVCTYFGITYKGTNPVVPPKPTPVPKPVPTPVKPIINNKGDFKMDVCIVYFSPSDFSSALILSRLKGNCAMFCRNALPAVHTDVLKSLKVITIGGPKLGVAGEVYLSGADSAKTLIAVSNYLQAK